MGKAAAHDHSTVHRPLLNSQTAAAIKWSISHSPTNPWSIHLSIYSIPCFTSGHQLDSRQGRQVRGGLSFWFELHVSSVLSRYIISSSDSLAKIFLYLVPTSDDQITEQYDDNEHVLLVDQSLNNSPTLHPLHLFIMFCGGDILVKALI